MVLGFLQHLLRHSLQHSDFKKGCEKLIFLLKDTRNTSSYHFRSIIPKDLRIIFNGRPSFTISLRTGI